MNPVSRLRSANIRRFIVISAVLALAACSSPQQRAQGYYEHGLKLLAAHDERRAELEFRNAVKYNKKLLPAWKSLAQVEETTHNWGALIGALRAILELDPSDTTTRIKLGRLLLLAKAPDEALRVANDAKEPDGQNADLLALKAAILFKLNDTAGAVRDAQAALQVDPENTGAMFVLAGDRFSQGDAKGALEILDSPAMAKKSDAGIALFKLQILEKTRDVPQAEALLLKLIDLYPKEVAFKKELIKLYLFQHRNDDAEKEQRAIITEDPTSVQAQLELVRLLNLTKGQAAARQQLDSLVKADGDTFVYKIALAQLEYTQGSFAESSDMLKGLIANEKSSDHVLAAQIDLAEMYLRQKQEDAAAALVADVLKKDARNINGLKLRASIRMDRGELPGAVSDLRQALNDQPRAADLMLMLAVAYERSGSIDLAEKEFADAMRVSNYDPRVSLNYVAFLQRRGSISRAEDVLIDLAGRWPKNVEVLSALGQVRLARQEWAGAQEVAESLQHLGNNPALADEFLGAALAGRNKISESIAALQDAYTSAPTAVQPMYALVRTYLRAEKPDQAIVFLNSVLKANPSNAEAYVLLGSVQLAGKKLDDAKQSFTTAIAKQPTNVIGYRALSDFYVLQKNNDEALKVTQAGLKQQPDSLVLHLGLADIQERMGNNDAAIAEYENLLHKDPGSIVVANNLASLLSEFRNDKASLDRADEVAASLRKSPLPQFKDTLGWVRFRKADYKAALPLLEDAATALPKLALVHYHLGMCYAAVGQPDQASSQFKMALGDAPSPDLGQKIQAALAKSGAQ